MAHSHNPDWRPLAVAIVPVDGALKAPADALAAFAGAKLQDQSFYAEAEAVKRTPKAQHEDLALAFLWARVTAMGVDPTTLNDFARGLGGLARTPLGMCTIEREAARLVAGK